MEKTYKTLCIENNDLSLKLQIESAINENFSLQNILMEKLKVFIMNKYKWAENLQQIGFITMNRIEELKNVINVSNSNLFSFK